MATILINAAYEEELRIAILDEKQKIRDLVFEHPEREDKIHNLYKGVITGVEASLNAVFVDYGAEKHGFLPIKDISPVSFYRDVVEKAEEIQETPEKEEGSTSLEEEKKEEDEQKEKTTSSSKTKEFPREVKVEDIKAGQELIVQVDKEERGNKGAALTNQISLAGRYLVLMPDNPQAGGISRRIEGEDRDILRENLRKIKKPDHVGVIIRTSGVNKTIEELQWDLDMLLELWQAIQEASVQRKAPFLILQEGGVVNRIFRDYLSHDIEQIIVDESELYEKLKNYINLIRPKFSDKLKLYEEEVPLFSRHNVENQIENVYQASVRLDSGASIVIDSTEALVSIDVNSARATRGSGIEETALQINLEAADEIARQLRLRDIGGLIVIDFIDMGSLQNQKEVEARLKTALRADRARVQIGRISRFGLLEMSRQRLKSSLSEETQVVCPRCKGEGHIRSIQSLCLGVLRILEEDAIRGQLARIQIQVPVEMAAFFLNEKRNKLVELENKYSIKIVILPNLNFHVPHYQIKREKASHKTSKAIKSHEALESYKEVKLPQTSGSKKTSEQSKPAVDFVVSRPAPTPSSEREGLLKRLISSVFGGSAPKKEKETKPAGSDYKGKRPYKASGGRRHSSRQGGNRHHNYSHSKRNQGRKRQYK
jgi:ribonuclease E